MTQVPIAERLFTWPSEQPQLLGSKCIGCGTIVFPAQDSCPGCGEMSVEDVPLARRGTLWTWTTQSFPPVAPPYRGATTADFEPFGIGWVVLPGEVMVEARLTEADPAILEIGMPVELVVEPFVTDADGNEVVSFAFRPVNDALKEA